MIQAVIALPGWYVPFYVHQATENGTGRINGNRTAASDPASLEVNWFRYPVRPQPQRASSSERERASSDWLLRSDHPEARSHAEARRNMFAQWQAASCPELTHELRELARVKRASSDAPSSEPEGRDKFLRKPGLEGRTSSMIGRQSAVSPLISWAGLSTQNLDAERPQLRAWATRSLGALRHDGVQAHSGVVGSVRSGRARAGELPARSRAMPAPAQEEARTARGVRKSTHRVVPTPALPGGGRPRLGSPGAGSSAQARLRRAPPPIKGQSTSHDPTARTSASLATPPPRSARTPAARVDTRTAAAVARRTRRSPSRASPQGRGGLRRESREARKREAAAQPPFAPARPLPEEYTGEPEYALSHARRRRTAILNEEPPRTPRRADAEGTAARGRFLEGSRSYSVTARVHLQLPVHHPVHYYGLIFFTSPPGINMHTYYYGLMRQRPNKK